SVAGSEEEQLGGRCVKTGCTPTKTMIAAAQVAHYARNAGKWGVRAGETSVDLPAIVRRKDEVVRQWRAGVEKKVQDRPNLHLYRGQARFVGPNRLRVGDQELEGERAFINTGTRVAVPRLEGLDQVDYLTNASIMELTQVPEHLVVLGGGYIGLEFGQMFRRFGCRVTIVHNGENILPREDSDVSTELTKALEAEGIRFMLNAQTTRIAKQNDEAVLQLKA